MRVAEAPFGVREADPGELPAVMNVLDGALLEADAATVAGHVEDGTVLVAHEEGRVLGACVVDPDGAGAHVEAIAVRPRRRDRGIGSALVETAAARWGELTAGFDGRARPFYESLGFAVEPAGDGRFRGRRPVDG